MHAINVDRIEYSRISNIEVFSEITANFRVILFEVVGLATELII